VTVTDRSAAVTAVRRQKAEPANPGHVAAPMPGKISAIAVRRGQSVRAGEPLFSLEAMKMETAVSSPLDATVSDVLVTLGAAVDAGDLIVVIEP
jgi:pyruvate carboxylase